MASNLFSCKNCVRVVHLQTQFLLRSQLQPSTAATNNSQQVRSNHKNTVVAPVSTIRLKDLSPRPPVTTDNIVDAGENIEIVIPRRKKRDELSVLKALASTVRYDYAAPNYRYIDDPFTIPQSGLDKRSYTLAKASGIKAAQYVIKTYPKLFENNPAAPNIEAFMPPTGPQFGEDSLEGLQERIDLRQPFAAYESYRKLKSAGTEIPSEAAEDLLDLLCFYNSEDPPESLVAEELYFRRDVTHDDSKKIRKDWKDEGPAETVFKDFKSPSVRAQCSLIRGRAKFFQCDKAFELFQQLRQKGVKPDIKTYDAVLGISSFLSDDATARWQLMKSFLRDMAADGIEPTIDTFNAVMYALSRCKRHRDATQWVLQTINEMKKCEIEPTLTTWYYALLVHYPFEDANSRLLYSVLEYLKGKEFKLRDISDYEFFSCAMSKCFYNVKDMDLAYKLDALLNTGTNRSLLGDSFREGLYYTNFMRLLCMFEQIDKVMEQYERITPNDYTPTFTVVEDLLSAIELNDGFRYLPKIWSDLILFQYQRRSDLVEHILRIIVKKKQDDSQLQEVFVKVANSVQKQYETDLLDRKLTRPLVLSGRSLGDMALIHLYADNFDRAWDVLQMYVERRQQLSGFPSEQSLVNMAEACMLRKDVDKTLQVMTLMADFGYPKVDDLAVKVKDSMELSDQQRTQLGDLL